MRKGELTDVGKVRAHNEDSFYSFGNNKYCYGVVADGMGGHLAGEVASTMAISEIKEYIFRNLTPDLDCFQAGEVIRQAVDCANTAIYDYALRNQRVMGMGTTVTLAMVYKGKLITANVGDSRTYLVTDKSIKKITKDHSFVAELVDRGTITPEQAKNHPKRNYITRAVGTEETVKVDIKIRDYKHETVLLCSDGLTNMVDEHEIMNVVANRRNLKRCARKLRDLANLRGGTDNITVVLYRKER